MQQAAELRKASSVKTRRGFQFGTLTIILLTGVLFIFLGLTSKTFFSYRNIYTIFYGVSIEYFAILGFTLLLIMGEVDLSVGSVYCFSGALLGVLVLKKVPLSLALFLTVLCCIGFGMLTGFLVTRFSLNSLMVTIGMMAMVRGLAWVLIRMLFGRTFPRSYRALARAKIGNVNTTIFIMIVLVLLLEICLRRSTFFKKMYYVGENLKTAKIYGIRAEMIKVFVFAFSSFTAAVGGILISSRITHADVTTGDGLEFKVLTAAILGGASLFGGKGSILSSVVGLIFLATIVNGMIIFKIEPLLQQLVVGVILILSVFIDTRLNRNKLEG